MAEVDTGSCRALGPDRVRGEPSPAGKLMICRTISDPVSTTKRSPAAHVPSLRSGRRPRPSFILGEMSKIAELGGATDPLQGVVRVGVTETFALVCLPRLMQALQREHPLLRMEIVVATSAHLEDQLLGRELDLAFIVNPTSDPRLRLLPLGVQETTWLAAPSFGLSPPVRPQDMQRITLDIEAIDRLLEEELNIRENRRIGVALSTARPRPKTWVQDARWLRFLLPALPRQDSSGIANASWRSRSSTSSPVPRWCPFSARRAHRGWEKRENAA
jgi:DNA-binding transcriptional LysR family regulator